MASGIYEIVDLSDINNPIVQTINYAGSTENSVTNIATQDVTYISLDEDGVIHQSINFPDPNERRQYAFIGRLNHTNRTSISFADTFPDFKLSPVSSFYDLVDALAPFKMDQGLKPTPNGVNLSFNVSAGKVFFRSDNYATDKNNPHTKSFTSQVLAPFRKMTQTSTVDSSDMTVLEPSYYDLAGTRTIISGGPNQATIQRIYKYKSGAIRVAYGQNVYTNMNDARAAVNFDSFIENPTINQTAVLIAFVIITKGCTDLSDPSQCVILPASRFGSVSGGGGGGTGSGVIDVADLTARDAIPTDQRKEGLLVYVYDTDGVGTSQTYQLVEGISNAHWVKQVNESNTAVLTNKDIDGGVASNTSRVTVPKNTKTNLDGLSRKQGTLCYSTTDNKLYFDDGVTLVSLASEAASIPAGVILPYAGSSTPSGYLPCLGQAVSRTTYSALFFAIGTHYGSGDGSTTFNLPNPQALALRFAGDQTYNTVSYSAYLGQKRNDAIQNITGEFGYQGDIGSSRAGTDELSGVFAVGVWRANRAGDGIVGGGSHRINFNASRVARTDTQTHGADMAFNGIIKY